jgi:P27 family predicted phage terminase small subunit
MPRGGQNTKPTEVREREGNAGHRPIPPVLLLGGRELVEPEHLADDVLPLWRELVGCLGGERGILIQIDVVAVELAAVQWARVRAAGEDVKARGIIVDGKPNPAVRIERDAGNALRMLMPELGLSPAARARLSALGIVAGGSAAAPAGDGDDGQGDDVPHAPQLQIVRGGA